MEIPIAPRHVGKPGHEPEQAEGAESDEEGPPAETRDEHAAEKETKAGAEEEAGTKNGVGETALSFGEVKGEDFAVGGIGDGFTEAKEQSQSKKENEGVDGAGEGGGDGPKREASGEDEIDIEAIDQPTGDELGAGVGPKKSGEKEAEASGGKGEFALKQRRGDGEIATVDVIDEDGEAEEDEGDEETSRDAGGRSGGGVHDFGGDMIVQAQTECKPGVTVTPFWGMAVPWFRKP